MRNDITTTRLYPPIPDRSHDWMAMFSFHDADDDPLLCGYGETEADAVLDLMTNAVDFEDDGYVMGVIVELAFQQWWEITYDR
jgi:hypothetical protein